MEGFMIIPIRARLLLIISSIIILMMISTQVMALNLTTTDDVSLGNFKSHAHKGDAGDLRIENWASRHGTHGHKHHGQHKSKKHRSEDEHGWSSNRHNKSVYARFGTESLDSSITGDDVLKASLRIFVKLK